MLCSCAPALAGWITKKGVNPAALLMPQPICTLNLHLTSGTYLITVSILTGACPHSLLCWTSIHLRSRNSESRFPPGPPGSGGRLHLRPSNSESWFPPGPPGSGGMFTPGQVPRVSRSVVVPLNNLVAGSRSARPRDRVCNGGPSAIPQRGLALSTYGNLPWSLFRTDNHREDFSAFLQHFLLLPYASCVPVPVAVYTDITLSRLFLMETIPSIAPRIIL